jgi:hypothetical protein
MKWPSLPPVIRLRKLRWWRLDPGNQDPLLAYSAMLARLAELASQSEVVHSHLGWVHIPLLRRLSVPFVTTLHGRIDALGVVKEALHWRVVQTITFAAHRGDNADEGSWFVEPARYDPQDHRR